MSENTPSDSVHDICNSPIFRMSSTPSSSAGASSVQESSVLLAR